MLIFFAILLVGREVTIWYFKIGDILKQQSAAIAEAAATNELLRAQMKQSSEIAKKQLEQQEFTNTLLQDLLKK